MLSHLFEFYDFVEETSPLKKKLSKKKLKHSKRVAKLVKELSDSNDVYNAALYHDYLEVGGKMKKLDSIISYESFKLVLALTKKDTDGTIETIKKRLSGENQSFINDVIKIKLCDRYDNLRKRNKKGELKGKYLNRSIELIQYLYDKYIGMDKYIIEKFIEEYVFTIPGMKNKIILL